MTAETTPQPTARSGRMWRNLTQNPITTKELRSRMRGARAYAIMTSYLFVMGAFVAFIYLIVAIDGSTSANTNRQAGQAIFFTMVGVQTFLVVFIGPAFTSGAITGEKERQTFDLLRTTLLSPRAFVFGKMMSALSYVFLLIIAAIPLISMAFMLGGVAVSEVLISQLLLAVGAIFYAMLGLFFSSRMRTTLAASVTTYAVALGILVGLPLLVGLSSLIASPFFITSSSRTIEAIIGYGLMGFATTNLPITMFISDMILREENSLWGATLGGSGSPWIFSPWYVFIVINLFFSYLLYRWTVKRVTKMTNE